MTSQQGFWLLFFVVLVLYCADAFSQDSAVEIFQMSQEDGYEWATKDDQQDWTVFWLCREIDRLHETMAANEIARREDDKELRAQLWKLALIVGGGGAVGGAGGAAAIRIRKRSG